MGCDLQYELNKKEVWVPAEGEYKSLCLTEGKSKVYFYEIDRKILI